jgi:hypothetical protein
MRALAEPAWWPDIEKRANQFVEQMRKRASGIMTNNVLALFGNDFRFVKGRRGAHSCPPPRHVCAAPIMFKNMERLMKYINANPAFKVNVRFASVNEVRPHRSAAGEVVVEIQRPWQYFQAVAAARPPLPVYSGDWMPYSVNSKPN